MVYQVAEPASVIVPMLSAALPVATLNRSAALDAVVPGLPL
jgi:hypothetical protein